MNSLVKLLIRLGVVRDDLDYHFVRASMVITFLLLGTTSGSSSKRRP
jgi:hypothetical protein